MRSLRRFGLAVALLLAVACSDDDSGPGAVTVSLDGPVPLGGAVVEITGPGIQGVSLPAQGWVEWSPVSTGANEAVRVLVLVERPGELAFRVQLRDLAAPPRAVRVLDAVDGSNRPVADPTAIRTRVGR